jgi:hypothetical protein
MRKVKQVYRMLCYLRAGIRHQLVVNRSGRITPCESQNSGHRLLIFVFRPIADVNAAKSIDFE